MHASLLTTIQESRYIQTAVTAVANRSPYKLCFSWNFVNMVLTP